MRTSNDFIHPEDSSNVKYWTKKWGVSIRQLNDAILDTGSLNPAKLKAHFRKENRYYLPFFGFIRLFKSRSVVH